MSRIRSILSCVMILFMLGGASCWGQGAGPYAPPAGHDSTTAMYKDSSAFIKWGVHCTVQRGPMDATDTSKGYAGAGSSDAALGKAQENGVVSLGDGGEAVLTFGNGHIYNGPGPDFAVFENSFDGYFLELAFVEVSSNGSDYFRFPAVSLTDTSEQVDSFDSLDATNIHMLAGKYQSGHGTPFDLDSLPDTTALEKDSITHVRVIDVVGNIDTPYATYDRRGHPVNDPWPTDFNSGGFDLDAIGVVHYDGPTVRAVGPDTEVQDLELYPMPVRKNLNVHGVGRKVRWLVIRDMMGREVHREKVDQGPIEVALADQDPGYYRLSLIGKNKVIAEEAIIIE